jgi:selenocysteine lyase/cysteine desulfurase
LALLTKCGIKTVFSRIQALHARLIQALESTQYQPVQLGSKHNRSGIVSLSGPKTADLHAFLMSKNIFVSLREGNIRVSPHFYNTVSEIDRLSNAIIQFERKLKQK